MSIGLIVTNISTKVIPDKTLNVTTTPKVLTASFGDGYEQRIADGLNSLGQSFTVNFMNRAKADADDIISFFEANKGVTSFDFTIPNTNSTSTATAVLASGLSNSTNVTLTNSTNNLNITAGATVTGTGISGTVTVSSIAGTALVLSSAQSVSSGVTLTFSNPNEKTIKVLCTTWGIGYSNSDHYNVNATFKRVYET